MATHLEKLKKLRKSYPYQKGTHLDRGGKVYIYKESAAGN